MAALPDNSNSSSMNFDNQLSELFQEFNTINGDTPLNNTIATKMNELLVNPTQSQIAEQKILLEQIKVEKELREQLEKKKTNKPTIDHDSKKGEIISDVWTFQSSQVQKAPTNSRGTIKLEIEPKDLMDMRIAQLDVPRLAKLLAAETEKNAKLILENEQLTNQSVELLEVEAEKNVKLLSENKQLADKNIELENRLENLKKAAIGYRTIAIDLQEKYCPKIIK